MSEDPTTASSPETDPSKSADRDSWCLCLSGGGFRATFFHLGVIRLLWRAGLLTKVRSVASVSGGSILAAHLAVFWDRYQKDFASIAKELVAFGREDIRGRILRRVPALVVLAPLRWGLRLLQRLLRRQPGALTDALALHRTQQLERYYSRLLRRSVLPALAPADGPHFYILATNMVTGGPSWFSARGFATHPPESLDLGQETPGNLLPLGLAVAASSAYAPFFPPVRLDREDFGGALSEREFPSPRPYLTDGGVFDNLGLNAAQRLQRAGSTFSTVIVSDASAQLDWKVGSRYWFAPSIIRTTDILMHRVTALEKASGEQALFSPTWLSMTEVLFSKIRTDLDAFSPDEIRALVSHGYEVARRELAPATSDDDWDPCPPNAVLAFLRRVLRKEPSANGRDYRSLERSRFVRLGLWNARDYLCWAFLLVLGLALTGVWPLLRKQPGQRAPASPRARLGVILPNGVTLIDINEDASPLALSPDGRFLVFSGRSGNGPTRLYYRPIEGYDVFPLGSTEGASSPFFSSDGVWLGFVVDGKLRKMRFEEGRAGPVTSICDACAAPRLRGASWVGDMIVFAPSTRGPLFTVSATGGKPRELTGPLRDGEVSHRWPCVLPDGKAVVFATMTATGQENSRRIVLFSMEGRERRELLEGGTFPRFSGSGHLLFVRGGSLIAQPFDPRRGQLAVGEEVLFEDLRASPEDTGAALFDVSTSGVLAFVRPRLTSRQATLLWVTITGWQTGRATPVCRDSRAYSYPRVSPDGRRLAVTTSDGGLRLWTYDLAHETWAAFSSEDDGNCSMGIWLRDSSGLVFRSDVNGSFSLYQKPIDGSAAAAKVADNASSAWLTPTAIASDGRLAFAEEDPATDWDIGELELRNLPQVVDGSALATPLRESFAAYSPDGRWMAYVVSERGRSEVWVRSKDGKRRWGPVGSTGGAEPVWSPTGRQLLLFYRVGDRLFEADVYSGSEFGYSKPREVLRLDAVPTQGNLSSYYILPGQHGFANYDVARNGRLLMVGVETPNEEPQIVVVPSWFDELRRTAITTP